MEENMFMNIARPQSELKIQIGIHYVFALPKWQIMQETSTYSHVTDASE